jgi:hypothetical protein
MTKKPKRKAGRPTRREASKRALSGLDLSNLDPVAVLRTIAGDSSAPASARVAAAKALLLAGGQRENSPDENQSGGDAVSRQALRILQGGKK